MSKITSKVSSPTLTALLTEAKSQKISGYKLAKDTGLSLSTIQHFISGKGTISVHTAEAIAKVLGLEIKIKGKR